MSHIELARWADTIVVAPATANFIARLNHGFADDLLSTLCLASEARLLLAPAMNRVMWENAVTQANTASLHQRGVSLIGPASGSQACGESGQGRMVEAEEILAVVVAAQEIGPALLRGLRIVVTAGPTRERIDPVRYLSNLSSGKTGYALARAAAFAGAEVTLVSGPVALPTPTGVRRVDVESAAQMHRAVHDVIHGADIFIATAAVADHQPAATAAHKIKKSGSGATLRLEQTTDILASVAALSPRPYCIGFAAETQNLEEYAQQKLRDKGLDMVVANLVGEKAGKPLAFGTDDNQLLVIWPRGRHTLPSNHKQRLAGQLLNLVSEQLAATTSLTGEHRA